MRELDLPTPRETPASEPRRLGVIGSGRLGTAIAGALRAQGWDVAGPFGHGADGSGSDAVLLCVPDAELHRAASAVVRGPLVGHCSGATGLSPLAPHEAFSMHPLMTVTATGAAFAGAGAAVAGTSPSALQFAVGLAETLGMEPVHVEEADRAAYHAAASIASNFLITIESAAERLAATAGLERRMLVPLVRASVENWARLGGPAALTGPVARGDWETVERQRTAVRERVPELGALFDALIDATADLAGLSGSVR